MDDGNCGINDVEGVEWYDGPIYDEDWEDDDERAVEELTEEQKLEIRRREEEWIDLMDCSLEIQAIITEYSGGCEKRIAQKKEGL